MNAVLWRLHRSQAVFALSALAIAGVVLVVSGFRMAHTYKVALGSCALTSSCGNLSGQLYRGDGLIIDLVAFTTVALPGLLALFWGVPLVAKEQEEGTNVLAWTQSITRREWMRTNLTWALLAAAGLGAVVSGLVSWWRTPFNALYGRMGAFDIQGIVSVAYCVFAVALGIAAGVALKRVLPALAVTLGVLVTLRAVITIYLRPHYLAPVRLSVPLTSHGGGVPANAWVLSNDLVNPAGRVIHFVGPSSLPAACHNVAVTAMDSCMTSQGYKSLIVFQPDSRFWTLQGIEAGLFLVLAVPLVAFAYRRVCRGDA